MELARAGLAPAFAVLVHRHGDLVHGAVRARGASDEEATESVREVLLEAMTSLEDRDADEPVDAWLLALAGGDETTAPDPLPAEELDAVWASLHLRWPDGRAPRRRLPWRRAVALLVLVAVAAIVPTIALSAGDGNDEELEELRAVPLPDPAAEAADGAPDRSAPQRPDDDEADEDGDDVDSGDGLDTPDAEAPDDQGGDDRSEGPDTSEET